MGRTFSKEGKDLVRLIVTETGGAVHTFDKDGKTLVAISATDDGEGVIATFNRAGNARALWP